MSAKKEAKDEGPIPQSTAAALSSLVIYSIAMVLTPLVLFLLSAEKYFDRKLLQMANLASLTTAC